MLANSSLSMPCCLLIVQADQRSVRCLLFSGEFNQNAFLTGLVSRKLLKIANRVTGSLIVYVISRERKKEYMQFV